MNSALSAQQERAKDFLKPKNAQSFFLTGFAGSGKSHVLNELFVQERKRRGEEHVFSTALTGIAASRNLDCTTLHSFAGLHKTTTSTNVNDMLKDMSPRALRRWRACQLLFIDEVSMMDASLFENLEELARRTRNSTLVFGGIVLCLVGDFFQIPPVNSSVYCFESPLWPKVVGERTVLLTHSYRSGDAKLLDFLDQVRRGEVDMDFVRELESHCDNDDDVVLPTCLFSRNVNVVRLCESINHFRGRANNMHVSKEAKNRERFQNLPSSSVTFQSKDWSRFESDSKSEYEFAKHISPTLELKMGAQVMLCINLPLLGLVNGSRGVVVGFKEAQQTDDDDDDEDLKGLSSEVYSRVDGSERLPLVYFSSLSRQVLISRHEFVWLDHDGVKVKSRFQIPLRLAWALTMHKAQGQTIDRLNVCLHGVFEFGQAFAALSRASSFAGLSISGFSPQAIRSNPKVREFYENMKESDASRSVKKTKLDLGDDVPWLPRISKKKL